MGHLQRMRLANRGRLLLRTPGHVPFGTCICSNLDTILSWTCHVYGPSECRTSLGTSILLCITSNSQNIFYFKGIILLSKQMNKNHYVWYENQWSFFHREYMCHVWNNLRSIISRPIALIDKANVSWCSCGCINQICNFGVNQRLNCWYVWPLFGPNYYHLIICNYLPFLQ